MAKALSFGAVFASTLILFFGLVQTADISYCSPDITNTGAKQGMVKPSYPNFLS